MAQLWPLYLTYPVVEIRQLFYNIFLLNIKLISLNNFYFAFLSLLASEVKSNFHYRAYRYLFKKIM